MLTIFFRSANLRAMDGVNRLLIQLLDGAIELIEVFLEELGNFSGDDDDNDY